MLRTANPISAPVETQWRVVFSDGTIWRKTGSRRFCEAAAKQWNEVRLATDKRAEAEPIAQT
jgi:hypothetical protein